MHVTNDSIVLEVSDDGCGFDAGSEHNGFGLVGMRERVLIRDGQLTIKSSDTGTTLTATLPMHQPTSAAR
jgi:two-component system, NarL family, sensor histidine kinase UhpB